MLQLTAWQNTENLLSVALCLRLYITKTMMTTAMSITTPAITPSIMYTFVLSSGFSVVGTCSVTRSRSKQCHGSYSFSLSKKLIIICLRVCLYVENERFQSSMKIISHFAVIICQRTCKFTSNHFLKQTMPCYQC